MTPAARAALDAALAADTAEALLRVLPVLEVALHAAYNADPRQHRKCGGGHAGGTGHLVAETPDGHRCPAHAVARLHVERRRPETDWLGLLDEILRASARVRDDGLRRAVLVLAGECARRGGLERTDYTATPRPDDEIGGGRVVAVLGRMVRVKGADRSLIDRQL